MNIDGIRSGSIYAGTTFTLIVIINFIEPIPIDVDLALVTSWKNEDGHVLQDDMDVIVSNGNGHTSHLIYPPIATTDSGNVTVIVTVSTLNESLQMYIYPVTTSASEILNVEGKVHK